MEKNELILIKESLHLIEEAMEKSLADLDREYEEALLKDDKDV